MAMKLKTLHHIEILFVDYLNLISSDTPLVPQNDHIAVISRSLKNLAQEMDIPVVALFQLPRDAEEKRPKLGDLHKSGFNEQDADVVIFLHQEEERNSKADERPAGIETELIAAKQRNGPIGAVNLLFYPAYAAFESQSTLP
jgi:replicative DNA helicase